MKITTITVSSLEEAPPSVAAAFAAGAEFVRIVGAATLGGSMIEGEYGDLWVHRSGGAIGTRKGGSDAECQAKLRAAARR